MPEIPQPILTEIETRKEWKTKFMATLDLSWKVLSIRASLMVAILGAILLAYVGTQGGDVYRLVAEGIYCFGVVAPMLLLAAKKG